MELPEIQNFENVLTASITKNRKLIKTEKTRLTAPGDNYASLMLAVKLIFQDKDGQTEENVVAKLLPPSQFMRELMNIYFTFRNELGFYQTILPTLRQELNKPFDFFPKFFGGRLSLGPSSPSMDENAIILLENLKVQGFVLSDKLEGYDLETTKLLLKKIAELHAAVIALRETKPEVFEEKLAPFFEEYRIFDISETESFVASEVLVEEVIKALESDEVCVLHLDKIKAMINTCMVNLKKVKNLKEFTEDVFATLIHYDIWVNNIMVKTRGNKITDVKLVDWQLIEYASATKDILFFLFMCVQESLLKQHFDDLLLFYYKSLFASLEEFECPMEKFSFDAFQEELKRVSSQVTYFYIVTMIPGIFAEGDNLFDVSELTRESMIGQFDISKTCKRRICSVTREFIRQGWL